MQYAIINDLEFLNRHVLNSVSLSEGYDVDQVVYQGNQLDDEDETAMILLHTTTDSGVTIHFKDQRIGDSLYCPEFCLYVTEIENINPNYIDEAVGCGNMTIFNSDSKIDLIQAINDGSFTIT